MGDVEGLATVDMRIFEEASQPGGSLKEDELSAQIQAREREILRIEKEEAEESRRRYEEDDDPLGKVLDEFDRMYTERKAAREAAGQQPRGPRDPMKHMWKDKLREWGQEVPEDGEDDEPPEVDEKEKDWRLMFPTKMPPPLYDRSIPWDGRDRIPPHPATGRLPPENPPEKEVIPRGTVDDLIDWCSGKDNLTVDTAKLIIANESGKVPTPGADQFYPLENYIQTQVGPASGPLPDWLNFPEPEGTEKGIPAKFTPEGILRYDGVGVHALR